MAPSSSRPERLRGSAPPRAGGTPRAPASAGAGSVASGVSATNRAIACAPFILSLAPRSLHGPPARAGRGVVEFRASAIPEGRDGREAGLVDRDPEPGPAGHDERAAPHLLPPAG